MEKKATQRVKTLHNTFELAPIFTSQSCKKRRMSNEDMRQVRLKWKLNLCHLAWPQIDQARTDDSES